MRPRSTWQRIAKQDGGLGVLAGLGLILYVVFIIIPVLMSLKSSFTERESARVA